MIELKEKRIIPLKFDLMFKKIFGNPKDLMPLRELIKCILEIEAKKITILNPEIIGSSYYNKGTIVDLIVEIEDGTKIGIEMNTNVNKYLINRNLFYMFKIISEDRKKGSLYNELSRYIQINIDCEGKHSKPIMRYKLREEEIKEILTEKIEIIRVDLPYYVKKCYNEDANNLDYKDKFIGMLGIEEREKLKEIIKGEKNMEDIMKNVEEFSEEEEILGAYDAEWHKQETERLVRLGFMDEVAEKVRESEEKVRESEEKNLKIVKNMLKENIDIATISKVTGLSIEKLNHLK